VANRIVERILPDRSAVDSLIGVDGAVSISKTIF
jgi:hypothetical protein